MTVEIVAEFTTNHLGNTNLLASMVKAAKKAGADCVKMQSKCLGHFYSKEKLDSEYPSPYGKTYRDYRKTFELEYEDWRCFDSVCFNQGIKWFVTPQDLVSLDECVDIAMYMNSNLERYKISSTNAASPTFVAIAADTIPTDREVVVSVAGQTIRQIESVVDAFQSHKRLWLLHCVAEYPCPVENLRLGNITELRKHFAGDQVKIGYSGHEVGYLPTLAAVEQYGAEMVERHFCISRNSFAHHIECSLEPDEFKAMVDAIRNGSNEAWSVPDEACRTEFGMTEKERTFLEDQQYGR